ncbi:MAG: Protein translocase subunit SecF [uncultured Solirubrobacteraceae bacterium]|uniref:Protein-export membrane protein SecF n=1 Tax=uncultured Solirubrobacteraceae bacterium TaxID=1162706 RepID=A0A6J4RTX4_9ACTN|nr:MAG: Protein translocase subunit SecF [uncultured Solirubrobacteraceae bacterium]
MLRIFHNTTFDFIRWWRWAAGLTAAFIAIGLASFAVNPGLNRSIEFTGGTLMQLQFAQPPRAADVRGALESAGVTGAEIQQFGSSREYTVRVQDQRQVALQAAGAEGVARTIRAALERRFAPGSFTVVRTEAVGPRVGEELTRGAIIAILVSSLITLIYLAFRFEWRFGLAAVLSSAHDVLVTLAFIKLMHLEISLTVVAGILTLLGYSLNDTIIIFDRVREDLRKGRSEPLQATLNRAINETLPRSVLTHVTTFLATLALLIFAGEVIRPFAWVMSFGIFVATFSSIYVAGPLLLWIEHKWPRGNSASNRAARPPQSREPRARQGSAAANALPTTR